MRTAREALGAVLLGVLSFVIVIGGMALTLAEANLIPAAPVTTQPPTDAPAPSPTLDLVSTQLGSVTPLPSATLLPSPTIAPTTTTCPPPPGWQPLFVQPGDTVDSLARAYGVSADLLAQQNCLIRTAILPPGAVVYVPPAPNTPRPTAVPTRCGPPATWIVYVVRPGDTLYRIGLAYGVTVTQLKLANCLVSDNIVAGQRLYVPNVPTRTPSVTPSLTPSLTPSSTVPLDTSTPSGDTPVPPTATDVPASPTNPPAPTETPTP